MGIQRSNQAKLSHDRRKPPSIPAMRLVSARAYISMPISTNTRLLDLQNRFSQLARIVIVGIERSPRSIEHQRFSFPTLGPDRTSAASWPLGAGSSPSPSCSNEP